MSERLTMIEDYIPVEEISYESSRERVSRRRNGHLNTLHLWWSRKPLAAARAAVYACFAQPARGLERTQLPAFFTELCHWTGPILPPRDAIRAAKAVVQGSGAPRVLDMFAGGGSIPLEALRLGASAIAIDLNPVAHLLQLCTLDYPQRYGKPLVEAVRDAGEWMLRETAAELGDLYPPIRVRESGAGRQQDLQGTLAHHDLTPIAFLWTRTVPSTARGFEAGEVPLVRQTWLRRKAGSYIAARPVVDRVNLRVTYEIVKSSAKSETEAIKAWGFDPGAQSPTCPYSGASITGKDIKKAGREGRMKSLLMAVVAVEKGRRGSKTYLAPDELHLPAEDEVRARLTALAAAGIHPPVEALPQKLTGGMCSLYGLDTYAKLFSERQLLAMCSFAKNARRAIDRCRQTGRDPEFGAAVGAYLALLVGRIGDRATTLCRWDNTRETTSNTFWQQGLPMIWNYSEANPFGGSSGDGELQLAYILDVIRHAAAAAPGRPAEVFRARAQKLPLPDASIDAVVTDPPYYDEISYADLSDFFYVWHRRVLHDVMPAVYATDTTPKKHEILMLAHRHGGDAKVAAAFFQSQMHESFAEAHRVLKPGGPLVAIYAHKTTQGWSTLIDSLRGAGFQVVEAWSLDTEMPDKAGKMDTATLASSIFMVAKRREAGNSIGNYATEVRPEMVRIVEARVRELMDVGISGADLVIACVGAGLRPYTRFDRVELPNGEELPSARFLDEVQREVLESILAAVFHIDRSGVGQVDKASRFYILGRFQYGSAAVEFGEINVLGQGLGIELSGVGSLADGRSALVKVKGSEVTLRDFTERGADEDLGLPGPAGTAPLIDVLHRLLWLMANDRMKVGAFLDQAKTDAGILRLLADALKGRALSGAKGEERTEEQKAVDRLLAQWSRVVESRAMPLLGGA